MAERAPIDPWEAASRCRCTDPTARGGHIYLNVYCAHRDQHLPLAEYGFPQTSVMTGAAEYHRAWMAGEYNADLPPESRPGYRKEAA